MLQVFLFHTMFVFSEHEYTACGSVLISCGHSYNSHYTMMGKEEDKEIRAKTVQLLKTSKRSQLKSILGKGHRQRAPRFE